MLQFTTYNSQFTMNYQLAITNVAAKGQSIMANQWQMANGKWLMATQKGVA